MAGKLKSFAAVVMGLTGIVILMSYGIGYRFFVVRTGSMGEKYKVGSMVVVKNTNPEQIGVGEVITYTVGESVVVTHRAIEKNDEERSFTTKGDANNTADERKVSFDNVIGRVIIVIPILGYFVSFLNSLYGKISIILMILIYIIYIIVVNKM